MILLSPRFRLSAGLAAVALLALPASAVARDTFVAQEPATVVSLSVHGSHGYRISVTNGEARRRVVLTARKGNARAVYSVRGSATGDRIEGNFGNLGRISVRFQPSAQKPRRLRVPRNCRGKPTTIQAGRFVGTIRFDGEEGFSSVAATSAKGVVASKHKLVCAAAAGASQSKAFFIGKDFAAVVVDHDRSVLLSTFNTSSSGESTPDGFTLGEAAVTETRGRIKIGRAVEVETEVDPVQASPLGVEPITATIAPPAPLEGTGSIVETPGSPANWSGDLRVRLPGSGVVALAGPEFTAVLCHGPDLGKKFRECEGKLNKLLIRASRYPLVL